MITIERYITKNGRKYEFVKVYPNYVQYRDIKTKTLICFKLVDLGLQEEMIPPPKNDLNVEKVKI